MSTARAQDLEPRNYSNIPTGLNFAVASYAYTKGDVVTDPALPLEDAEVDAHIAFLAYARSLNLLGRSAKVDVVVPYGWASGSAELEGEKESRTVEGLGDPRLRFAVNLYGAPAVTMEEFKDYKQDTIIGASVQISAPLGQYDSDKLLNIGTNRWYFKPEIGISKQIGPVILELAGAATIYTDNDKFLGDRRREQEPIYSFQAHLIYSFPYGIWVAVDGTYYTGGKTTVDGEEGDDLQDNYRIGGTASFPIGRNHSIKLYGSSGVNTRAGSDFDTFGIAWQYRWGGGL